MSDTGAMQTPLIDLLRSVPETLRGHWASQWNDDGLSTGHTVAPVGMYCHQAADRISELEAENQRLRDGISLHRADTKMRAGSLWGASQEDATLWALLGGGEK